MLHSIQWWWFLWWAHQNLLMYSSSGDSRSFSGIKGFCSSRYFSSLKYHSSSPCPHHHLAHPFHDINHHKWESSITSSVKDIILEFVGHEQRFPEMRVSILSSYLHSLFHPSNPRWIIYSSRASLSYCVTKATSVAPTQKAIDRIQSQRTHLVSAIYRYLCSYSSFHLHHLVSFLPFSSSKEILTNSWNM